jgi:uncharacterized protein
MITCQSGRRVNPWEITEDDLCVEDIAHSLALINRFGGHTREPINVAWHSCCVAWLVGYKFPHGAHAWSGRTIRRQALLHDASEAFLADMNRWVKQHPDMEAYRILERDVQGCIYNKWTCPNQMTYPVQWADDLMVRLEMSLGYDAWPTDNPNFGPLNTEESDLVVNALQNTYECPDWREAERIFLEQFALVAPVNPV